MGDVKMDPESRETLKAKLQNIPQSATQKVSHTVEASDGPYRVVLTETGVDHFYDGNLVGKLNTAEMDPSVIDYLSQETDAAMREILAGFRQSFDGTAFHEKVAKVSTEKAAAHATQDGETHQMITQKQLDEQKVSLHPRTDEHYSNIQEKQLPEHGQRPGTYNVVTEGQLRDERTTFYGDERITGDWKDEDRNTITENQFEAGVGTYSEVGESDRGEVGAKFDGGLDKQHQMIGEKQLDELLNHHEYVIPHSITEGKEQLGKQKGELGRLTAASARKIIREAEEAMAKTVLAAGVRPDQVIDVITRLTSHDSKIIGLADTLEKYQEADVSTLDAKIADARYFGKNANVGQKRSANLIADILVRQLAKLAKKHDVSHYVIAEALRAKASDKSLPARIGETADQILANTDSPEQSKNIFSQIVEAQSSDPSVKGSPDEDGLYRYQGGIEDVGVSTEDREKFAEAAIKMAKTETIKISGVEEGKLQVASLDVDEKNSAFSVLFQDPAMEEARLAERSKKRQDLLKEAESKPMERTAQTPGGMGGEAPMAGGGASSMGNPAPPPGGADMGAPPVESLGQPPMGEGPVDGAAGEPMPPGSFCPVCKSDDVDVSDGDISCNNCGSKGKIHVQIEMDWKGTIEEKEIGEEAGGAPAEGLIEEEPGLEPGGEGGGTTLPNVPMGAASNQWMVKNAGKMRPIGISFRVTEKVLDKLAEDKRNIGDLCPSCSGDNTMVNKSLERSGSDGVCLDCFQEYNVKLRANKNDMREIVAQVVWTPKIAESDCTDCTRFKKEVVAALDSFGMSWQEFDTIPTMKERAEILLKLSSKGLLNLDDVQNKPLLLGKYASSTRWGPDKFDKFPSAACRERISRKYGENATSMSGPCRGKRLSDCVCDQLEGLGIYTDGLAAKVASVQASKEAKVHSPSKTCATMLVQEGMDMEEAFRAADALRAAYADNDDLVVEAIISRDSARLESIRKQAQAEFGEEPVDDGMDAGVEGVEGIEGIETDVESPPMDDLEGDIPGEEMDLGEDTADDMLDVEMDEDIIAPVPEGGLDQGLQGLRTFIESIVEEVVSKVEGGAENLPEDLGPEMGELGEESLGEEPLGEEPMEEGLGEEEGLSDEIPGLESEPGEELEKSSEPEDGKPCSKAMPMQQSPEAQPQSVERTAPEQAKPCGKPMPKAMPMQKQRREQPVEQKPCMADVEAQLIKQAEVGKKNELQVADEEVEKMLYSMKRGTMSKTADAAERVFAAFADSGALEKLGEKIAQDDVEKMERGTFSEKKLTAKPAQDAPDVGKVQDGKSIGGEESFTTNVSNKPDVPRSQATIGDEGKDNTVSDKDQPVVPTGNARLKGEENYDSSDTTTLDGNQGGGPMTSASETEGKVKEAETKEETGIMADNCVTDECLDKIASRGGAWAQRAKLARTLRQYKGKQDKAASTIEPKSYIVDVDHTLYDSILEKAAEGNGSVSLKDGYRYSCDLGADLKMTLSRIAKCCDCKKKPEEVVENIKKTKQTEEAVKGKDTESFEEIKKESQTVSPKSVKKLEDDPDLNKPESGKVKADEAHSFAVDEPTPSEGVSEPDVPEAPDGGRLTREHTVEKATDGPEIPAGGGSNERYDTNEDYTPEKLDQTLGKENDLAAMASVSRDEAVRVAALALKAGKIKVDTLPKFASELSKLSEDGLKEVEELIKSAAAVKGLDKEAKGGLEQALLLKSAAVEQPGTTGATVENIQGLFFLEQQNREHEWYQEERNKAGL